MNLTWTFEEILVATDGVVLSSPKEVFNGVGTDTRADLKGQIFIALKGETFDAHNFLPQAIHAGASALVVSEESNQLSNYYKDVSIILVKDTLKALQDMATFWRQKLKGQVIAITGSAGKTTTKEFLATLLSSQFETHFSRGSFNNHWGVPLTLLSCPLTAEKIVVEMGMNHSGEITRLCEIARPDAVMVTMVGSAHIGQFGSQDELAKAKEEIYESCPKAIQVFNLDNDYTDRMYERRKEDVLPEKMFLFSSYRKPATVSMRCTEMDFHGMRVMGIIGGVEGEVEIPIFGRQNVVNVMAASTMAMAVGMTGEAIWKVLPQVRTTWGRGQIVHLENGTTALFDAYNANPESMSALIKSFYEMQVQGKKVAILGEMLELGTESDSKHRFLGETLGNTDIDLVWFIGPHAKSFEEGIKSSMFEKTYFLSDTYEQGLAKKIGSMLNSNDVVVLKGSRGMKLEQVLKEWSPIDF
ncbi:MAG: UDP-N-acetylmuramoyl-tripeptide--D-alanyl-D-alanine ligase [Bdellovibrionales bacterium]|nr:UDP-N-acetylmuramoyl-tripeptide--D-alanyl-D-alanine ligase [Bdellovibrionales bacterium]